MLVITLSSVPPRFGKIGATLESLAGQGAEKVLLYIPETYRRFPDWDGTLPKVPEGVEIRRLDEDFGPATKVLGAAREFRRQDVDLLFCDDDQRYGPGWAQTFLDLKARHPGAVIATLGFHAYDAAGGSRARDLQPRALRRWRVTEQQIDVLPAELARGAEHLGRG
nr:glycosyltransferase family A protein [Rhodobacter sp.]